MLDSIRIRLTLWYTGVLALVIVVLCGVAYFIFWRSAVRRTDLNLVELSDSFLVTLRAELNDPAGPEDFQTAAHAAIDEHHFRDTVYVIVEETGKIVLSSQETLPPGAPARAARKQVLSSASFQRFLDASVQSERLSGHIPVTEAGYRAFARRFSANGRSYTLIILQSLHSQKETMEEAGAVFAWLIPLAILLASGGGYFLARKSLAPVVAMSSQAGRIGAENLHERLAIQNEKDELGHLARSFNGLLNRLRESFDRQRRFMADASHELRTPIAILRGESEVALSQQVRSPAEYRE